MNLSIAAQAVTMTSQEIADLVGSRHDSVKLTINRLSSDRSDSLGNVTRNAVIQLPPMVEVKNHLGQTVMVYLVCKRDSFIVVAQLCPEFTARLVDRWQELEAMQVEQFSIPQTLSGALRLAAEQAEQIERQSEQLAIAAPKVAFVDSYVEATGLMGFRQVAKLLSAKEYELSRFLEDERIMYRLGGRLTPYARHIDAQRFEMRTGTGDNGRAYMEARWTPKGVEWLAGQWAKHKINKGG